MSSQPYSAEKRRPSIGLMIGSFHTDYSRLLVGAICHALKDEANCLLYQGFDAERFLSLGPYVNENFDGHYYSLFEYAKFMPTDLLIVSFGTISALNDAQTLDRFLAALPQVPVILLEEESSAPNTWYVTVDNYQGMKTCVEHLIEVHGCRRILFVSGPRDVHDAGLRLAAYRDAMREHGLELREDMIGQGNFTDRVDDVIEALLARYPHPDAIVCANDEMAESAYRVLLAHGLTPGKDVAVTGFDDNVAASFMDPPLTTVRQSKQRLAEAAADLARRILGGETPAPLHLSAELICRCSCGCQQAAVKPQPSDLFEIGNYEGERRSRKALTQELVLSALVLRNLLRENISVHRFFRYLGQSLHSLGLKRSWVALLKEPLPIDGRTSFFLPDELRLHMVQDGADVTSWSRSEAPVCPAFCPDGLDPHIGEQCPAAVFPLFYGNLHYGVFVAEFLERERLFYYTISLELGTGLRYLYMALDEQEARAALEEKNQILDFSASHDSLTGLYNRVGAMNEIYNFVRASGKGRRFVVVMADLDHLKQINDSFGHSAGDTAIRTAARLLRQALPPGSILGRIGGDEFIAFFLQEDTHSAEDFVSRLRALCRSCDEQEGLPYYVGISTGCHAFSSESTDIPQQIKLADQRLYENKRLRRPQVAKPSCEI